MTRIALYARYSTENQRDASIADQLHPCSARAETPRQRQQSPPRISAV